MGSGRWSDKDWTAYKSTSVAGKTTREIYTSSKGEKDFDPKNIKIRESRDSELNPESNAIIIGLDVTGSMNVVLDSTIKNLNILFDEIYKRKPVSDPHLMVMGIGDVTCDSYPLQVSQFEADIKIAEQLSRIYLENGGGGNNSESYTLPWYFAAMKTSIDCFEKRNKKGYLFTIGDECVPGKLSAAEIRTFVGDTVQGNLSAQELLHMASRQYNVFHLILTEGSNYRHMPRGIVEESWREVLGQRAIIVNDHTKISEIIVSTIQINEGMNRQTVIESWDGSTSIAVKQAVSGLEHAVAEQTTESGVVFL